MNAVQSISPTGTVRAVSNPDTPGTVTIEVFRLSIRRDADELATLVLRHVARPEVTHVLIDLAAAGDVDQRWVVTLIGCRRVAAARRVQLGVVNPPAALCPLLRTTGVLRERTTTG
jgi:hypothetical protein